MLTYYSIHIFTISFASCSTIAMIQGVEGTALFTSFLLVSRLALFYLDKKKRRRREAEDTCSKEEDFGKVLEQNYQRILTKMERAT